MNILIVFGSLLGKTKRLSVLAGIQLQDYGFNVKVKDVCSTTISELEYHDLVILACSTWDDGMLQFDFREFNTQLMHSKFTSKNFAVIGVGGRKYIHFCTAADILASSIKLAGGHLVIPQLKLDLDHDEEIDKVDNQLIEWVKTLAQSYTTI